MIHVTDVKNTVDRIADTLHKQGSVVSDEIVFAYGLQSLGVPGAPGDLEEYPKVVKELLRRTGFLKWDVD